MHPKLNKNVANLPRFTNTFWVDVSNPRIAQNGFSTISDKLKLSGDGNGYGLWELSRTRKWLLILDNADKPEFDYSIYFPACSHGSVILISTSDSSIRYQTAGYLKLQPMGLKDSVSFLHQAANRMVADNSEEHWCAADIASRLVCHALSLQLAAARIAIHGCTFSQYLSEYQEQLQEMTATLTNQESKYTGCYAACEISATTFLVGNRSGDDAQSLIHLMSHEHSDTLPTNYLNNKWLSTKPYRSKQRAVRQFLGTSGYLDAYPDRKSSATFQEALDLLSSLALVSVRNDQVTIHPVIRAWAQDRQMPIFSRPQSVHSEPPEAVFPRDRQYPCLLSKVAAPYYNAHERVSQYADSEHMPTAYPDWGNHFDAPRIVFSNYDCYDPPDDLRSHSGDSEEYSTRSWRDKPHGAPGRRAHSEEVEPPERRASRSPRRSRSKRRSMEPFEFATWTFLDRSVAKHSPYR